MGKNHKAKRHVPFGGRSHVVKTTQERSEYDDRVRTAPTMNPTDEIRSTSSEGPEAESVESQHAGVAERRTRINPPARNIPWRAISGIIAVMILTATVVTAYVSLKGKVDQIDSLVIESKTNTEKMRDNLINIYERLAQLETKLDAARLATERSEQYLIEIESLKASLADIQAKSKELKEVALRQIEQRIEHLEKELSREKDKTGL